MPWFAASSVLFLWSREGNCEIAAVEWYSQSIPRSHDLCYLVFTIPNNICIGFVNP